MGERLADAREDAICPSLPINVREAATLKEGTQCSLRSKIPVVQVLSRCTKKSYTRQSRDGKELVSGRFLKCQGGRGHARGLKQKFDVHHMAWHPFTSVIHF